MDLIGRDNEVRTIRRLLARPPALIVIRGDAGSGKTRLLREVSRHAKVVSGQCRGEPLSPIMDALATIGPFLPGPEALNPVTGVLAAAVPELAHLLPPPPPGQDRPPHQVLRAIRELLSAAAPVTLVIDDAQHIDPESLSLLTFLGSAPPEQVSVIVALRPVGADHAVRSLSARLGDRMHLCDMRLGALSPSQTHALLRAITGVDVSVSVAGDLWLAAGGRPLIVTELAHGLEETPELLHADRRSAQRGLDAKPLPPRLRDWLLDGVRELSEPAARVCAAAAILSGSSEYSVIKRVSGLDGARCAAAIAEGVAAGILIDDGLVRPATPILARALVENLSTVQRRLLHLRATRSLARLTPPPYADLAHHARMAQITWWSYAEKAADDALARDDPAEATRLIRMALESPRLPIARRENLARKLAITAANGLSHHETAALLGEMLKSTDLPAGVRGEVRLHLGLLMMNQIGQISAGSRQVERALPDLDAKPGLAARALSALSVPMWTRGPVTRCLNWMRQALQAAQIAAVSDLLLAVKVNQVTALLLTGDPAGRMALAQLPKSGACQAENAHLARGACSHADATSWLGHYRLADELLCHGQLLARQGASDFAGAISASTALRLDWYQGRWSGLAGRAKLVRVDSADIPQVAIEARLVLGLLALAQGDLTSALTALESLALPTAPDLAVPVAMTATGALATLLVSRDQLPAAAELMREALSVIRSTGNWVWAADIAPQAVDIHLGRDETQRAQGFLLDLAEGLRGLDTPLGRVAIVACEARMLAAQDESAAASAMHRRAARLYAALPRPYSMAQELTAAGRCLLDSEPEQGRRLLTRALARLEQLGAAREAGRCRMILRERGFTVMHRRGRRGYGDKLSPREIEVARLASEGLTNREIAHALFLSERTVEDHISRALRKTRAPSRRELNAGEANPAT